MEHPHVAEAAVVAAEDEARGTVVRAVVVTTPDVGELPNLTDELRSRVVDRVGRYASPRIVDYVNELPRNEVGKLRRVALR